MQIKTSMALSSNHDNENMPQYVCNQVDLSAFSVTILDFKMIGLI